MARATVEITDANHARGALQVYAHFEVGNVAAGSNLWDALGEFCPGS
eukprot:gene19052-30659_t